MSVGRRRVLICKRCKKRVSVRRYGCDESGKVLIDDSEYLCARCRKNN